MSRSGYTDDNDDPLAHGRWRQAVKRALHGQRGQALLRELVQALDAMDDKRLYPGSFATPEGEFCALGVLGAKRGTKMDDLGDEDDECRDLVGQRFGIAPAMAAEIMYMNDEYAVDCWKCVEVEICGPVRPRFPDWGSQTRTVQVHNDRHPEQRWQRMRAWAVENLNPPNVEFSGVPAGHLSNHPAGSTSAGTQG